jgi:hypothetical protein
MSALGHKQTFRTAIIMSALPPKADLGRGEHYVRWLTADFLLGKVSSYGKKIGGEGIPRWQRLVASTSPSRSLGLTARISTRRPSRSASIAE